MTIALRGRWIRHFTHLDNLPGIVAAGGLICDAQARQGLTMTEVGDVGIKEARRRRVVDAGPGGFVGDYVPFYFGGRSPMLYRIACDHRDGLAGRYPDGDRPLAYLATTVGAILDAGLEWVASDGNAATLTTRFSQAPAEVNTMIDWPLMKAAMWNNTDDDPDRQRRRMTEFLVHGRVPLPIIKAVAAYSDAYADRARAALAGALADRVVVRSGWYYGYGRR